MQNGVHYVLSVAAEFPRAQALLLPLTILVCVCPAMQNPSPQAADFSELLRTPAGIQTALERCDGHPKFESALANWLETTEPREPADRRAIRITSLRLLEDTTDRQIVLSLINGLLRHALEDLKRDPALVPAKLSRALYADIRRSAAGQRSKTDMMAVVGRWLSEDGSATDDRVASFIKEFLRLADPHFKGGASDRKG